MRRVIPEAKSGKSRSLHSRLIVVRLVQEEPSGLAIQMMNSCRRWMCEERFVTTTVEIDSSSLPCGLSVKAAGAAWAVTDHGEPVGVPGRV